MIAPDLARELSMSAAEIGLLSSAFFFSFAAAQIPLGICARSLRAEALHAGLRRHCRLGRAAVLASAPGRTLIAARVLMGVGSCCYLMAPLALYARRFSPERFGRWPASSSASAPSEHCSRPRRSPGRWRPSAGARSFLAVAGADGGCAALVAIVVREDEVRRVQARITKPCAKASPAWLRRCACPRSCGSSSAPRGLFELRADRRAVGRTIPHACVRLRAEGARRPAVRGRGPPDRRACSCTDRPTGFSAATRYRC